MAYKVTYTTVLKATAPDLSNWLATAPEEDLVGIELVEETPVAEVANLNNQKLAPAAGFISANHSTDGNQSVLIEVWASEEAYNAANPVEDASKYTKENPAPEGFVYPEPTRAEQLLSRYNDLYIESVTVTKEVI